jgi:hypothetical protein
MSKSEPIIIQSVNVERDFCKSSGKAVASMVDKKHYARSLSEKQESMKLARCLLDLVVRREFSQNTKEGIFSSLFFTATKIFH